MKKKLTVAIPMGPYEQQYNWKKHDYIFYLINRYRNMWSGFSEAIFVVRVRCLYLTSAGTAIHTNHVCQFQNTIPFGQAVKK
jgi:hypothetical protein